MALSKRFTAFLLVSVIGVVVLSFMITRQLHWTNGVLGTPLDDAWIHMQFARNLAQGNGFSYNPTVPTPGSTSPLWTLFLTIPAFFAVDHLLVNTLILSAFFMIIAGWLTTELTNLVKPTGFALVAGVATLATGRFAWAGWSGMEATAFAAFSLLAVWAYIRWGFGFLVGLSFGIASQLRPEGHALVVLAGLIWLWEQVGEKKLTLRPVISAALAYILTTLPYTLFSLSTTGKPLPNTFYAKASTESGVFSLRTLTETTGYHWQDNPISLLLLPIGIIAIYQVATLKQNRRFWLLPAWVVGLPLFTAVVVDSVWHHGRYTLPLIPFQMVLAAISLHWISQKFVHRGVSLSLGLLLILGSAQGLPRWADQLGKNSNEIIEIDVAIGNWLRENTPEDAVIAVDDIGAIGYLSERTLFDLQGLVSPEMWPVMRETEIGLPRNQATTRLLADVQPDYLAIFPTWHYELAQSTITHPIADFRTETHTIIFGQDAAVYKFESPYFPDESPEIEINALFGERILLQGYTVEEDAITFTWTAVSESTDSYALFVHFLDEDGHIIAQIDGKPGADLFGTSSWRAGDVVRDKRGLPLPEDEWVTVMAGFYLEETGVRLSAEGDDLVVLYAKE